MLVSWAARVVRNSVGELGSGTDVKHLTFEYVTAQHTAEAHTDIEERSK